MAENGGVRDVDGRLKYVDGERNDGESRAVSVVCALVPSPGGSHRHPNRHPPADANQNQDQHPARNMKISTEQLQVSDHKHTVF